uniref:Uncharacterized protein n=1 Tax=Siphoviridae sp. ctqpo8 TaxID=2826469 RepID=A0A8S5M2I8_9CAUD|nr:MAG TPA: hypothetical protein [Siphoviridae sp. ctqpo8]
MTGVCPSHHPTAARAGKSSPVRPNAEKMKNKHFLTILLIKTSRVV